jgi:hypothetical protein
MEGFDYDKYWIAKGKGFLDNSLTSLTSTLDNIITYLNGISLASFVGGLTISTLYETTNLFIYVLLIAPTIIFQFAKHFVNVKLKTNKVTTIDPRSPKQIENAYILFFKDLKKKVDKAKTASFLATLVAAVCIPIAVFMHHKSIAENKDLAKVITNLKADKEQLSSTQKASCVIEYSESFVKVKGTFLQKDDILINIEGTITEKKVKKDTVISFTGKLDSKKSIDEKYLLCDIEYFKAKRVLVIYKDLDQENAFIKTIN